MKDLDLNKLSKIVTKHKVYRKCIHFGIAADIAEEKAILASNDQKMVDATKEIIESLMMILD